MTGEEAQRRRASDRSLRARAWCALNSKAGTFLAGVALASLGWIGGTLISWRDAIHQMRQIDPIAYAAHVRVDDDHHADTSRALMSITRILEDRDAAQAKRDAAFARAVAVLDGLSQRVERLERRADAR